MLYYFTCSQSSKALKKYITGTQFGSQNMLALIHFEDALLSSVSMLAVIKHFVPYTVNPDTFSCSNAGDVVSANPEKCCRNK